MFFHDKQRHEKMSSPKTACYTRKGLLPLFSLVIELYEIFTAHKVHPTAYPNARDVYPLFGG
jgi:hypothetical protein